AQPSSPFALLPSRIPSSPLATLPGPGTALWKRSRVRGAQPPLGRDRDVNCVSTIFEGTEQLKTSPAMKKFSVFFQKFERLKQSLTPSLAKEGQCDTERKNATIFIENLMTFIRKASKTARA
uniref:Interleukin-5 n=1 Tax=Athene cunicularia TaxID=194338 RepID=A0A663MS17_ATHCN